MTAHNEWVAEGYDRHARFVSDLAGRVFSWLDPQPGERILDLGCGDGALTAEIANRGARVIGVDASESMVEAALARGLDARLSNLLDIDFQAEFDAVFSNAVLHWVRDAGGAVERIAAAMKPGGRFVAEFGAHGNVAAIITAMRAAARLHGGDEDLAGPWYFPTPAAYTALLEAKSLVVERIEHTPRPTPLPTGIEGWLTTFRKPFFDQYDEPARNRVLAEVRSLLAPSLMDEDGVWTADYVRLRVLARKPS